MNVVLFSVLIIISLTGSIALIMYDILIRGYSRLWKYYKQATPALKEYPFISVIVPFRNERDNIAGLLHVLQNQNYPSDKYEVIAVDDHSTDESSDIIKEKFSSVSNFHLLHSTGEGKKAALKEGILSAGNKLTETNSDSSSIYWDILNAKGELITTTDADCIPGNNWLKSIAEAYIPGKIAMLAGPVKMSSNNTFFSRFQAMEFMALQMCGAGAILANKAVFCSGANLTFTKKDWLSAQEKIEGENKASGDDVFLLHTLKRQNKKITFIKNRDAIVTTKTEKGWRDFMNQRMRWGGKSLSYKDKDAKHLAIVVMLSNLSFVMALLFFLTLLFFNTAIVWYTLLLCFFFTKINIDYVLLKEGAEFYDMKLSIPEFLLFSFMYPFYLVIAAFGSLFSQTKWKGRVV